MSWVCFRATSTVNFFSYNYCLFQNNFIFQNDAGSAVYPYHNKIKQRIKNGELVRYEYVEKYKQISPCLLLHFSTEPFVRPIREYRFEEYEEFFALHNLNNSSLGTS